MRKKGYVEGAFLVKYHNNLVHKNKRKQEPQKREEDQPISTATTIITKYFGISVRVLIEKKTTHPQNKRGSRLDIKCHKCG